MKAANTTRTPLVGLLSALLTIGLLSTVGVARDGAGADDNSMFGGGSSGGIGTVPATAGNNTNGPQPNGQSEIGGASEFKPTLRIVGTLPQVQNVLTDIRFVDGTGGYRWETVNGKFSVEVFGNTVVDLNRAAFADSSVKVQLAVNPAFAGGAFTLATAGGQQATQALGSGNLNLPLQRASRTGLLEGGLTLQAKSPLGSQVSLRMIAQAGTIQLEQRQ